VLSCLSEALLGPIVHRVHPERRMAIVPILAGNDIKHIESLTSGSGVPCRRLVLPLLPADQTLAVVTQALGGAAWLREEPLRAAVAMSSGWPRFLEYVLKVWRANQHDTAEVLWDKIIAEFTHVVRLAYDTREAFLVAMLSLGGPLMESHKQPLKVAESRGSAICLPCTPNRAIGGAACSRVPPRI
jgi:hypothetical protein